MKKNIDLKYIFIFIFKRIVLINLFEKNYKKIHTNYYHQCNLNNKAPKKRNKIINGLTRINPLINFSGNMKLKIFVIIHLTISNVKSL